MNKALMISVLLPVFAWTASAADTPVSSGSTTKDEEKEELRVISYVFNANEPETNAPVRATAFSIDFILRNLHALDQKVVRIEFAPFNINQEADGVYSCNVGSGNKVAVVLTPEKIGREWFGEEFQYHYPRSLFVRVTSGVVQNKYGARKDGAVLKVVGESLHKTVNGKAYYKW